MVKAAIILGFVLGLMLPMALAQLRVGFYSSTCPNAEAIIKQAVQKKFNSDRSITAALLRMHFHDCFVRGCDASILIDSTPSKPSEKSAGPNGSVRGFELIDEAKKALESACPNIVSCADIITVATRDSVLLAGGPSYSVPTGRRDGLVSNPNDVNLPGPTLSVSQAFESFRPKGFTLTEMVVLLGGHTVGISHCSFFRDRLTNFQGTGKPDPSMDSALVNQLAQTCSAGADPTVFLDQGTNFVVDNQYYKQLLAKKGILQIDQELATDKSSSGIVSNLASNSAGFRNSFAAAMVKMGRVDVLTGTAGNIRKNCRVFN
jgi:peroxidase